MTRIALYSIVTLCGSHLSRLAPRGNLKFEYTIRLIRLSHVESSVFVLRHSAITHLRALFHHHALAAQRDKVSQSSPFAAHTIPKPRKLLSMFVQHSRTKVFRNWRTIGERALTAWKARNSLNFLMDSLENARAVWKSQHVWRWDSSCDTFEAAFVGKFVNINYLAELPPSLAHCSNRIIEMNKNFRNRFAILINFFVSEAFRLAQSRSFKSLSRLIRHVFPARSEFQF